MRRPGRILAGAVLAGALALAGALLPAAAALAAVEEGTSEPTARTIPVAPVDSDSTAGQIVYAIADWLEQRLGAGSKGLKLTLAALMRAEEESGTVTVHLPGARLESKTDLSHYWALGDLAIAVTPRSGNAYDFETALPPVIDHHNGQLTIGDSAIAGTWRADLETTTSLDGALANLQGFNRFRPAVAAMSLGSLTVADELVEGDDGLWDSHSTVSLSNLRAPNVTLSVLNVTSSFEDVDGELMLAMRRDFDAFPGDDGALDSLEKLLPDALAPLVDAKLGRSEATITVQDLAVTGDDALTLGRLVWQIELDTRKEHANLGTRITVVEPWLGGDAVSDIPPGFMPHALTLDIALSRLPLRRIAESISELSARGEATTPDRGLTGDELLGPMDAADTAFEIREIRIDSPSYAFRADGRFNVKQASTFGIVGRLDARIRGLSKLMAMAAAKGKEDAVALLIVLQGLGRPVFEEGADEPVHAYELDLRRDGAITVNGIPFEMLLQGGLSPP